jgi:hypothetical protein
MLTVYKYDIPLKGRFTLELPRGAKILAFMAQHDTPGIWALLDPEQLPQTRVFRLVGTGHQVGDQEQLDYLGSCVTRFFVWHLFETHLAAGGPQC